MSAARASVPAASPRKPGIITLAPLTPRAARALTGSSRWRYPGSMRAATRAAPAKAPGPSRDRRTRDRFTTRTLGRGARRSGGRARPRRPGSPLDPDHPDAHRGGPAPNAQLPVLGSGAEGAEGDAVEVVEKLGERARTDALAQRGRAPHVGEEHGDVDLQPAGRKCVAAPRAQVRVLPGRTESGHTDPTAPDPAEGIVAELAAGRPGQV